MTGRTFLDTNVLVYAFDQGDEAKQQRGQRILEEAEPGEFVVSAQVLNEFYVIVTRKLARPLDGATARAIVRQLTALEVVSVTSQLVVAGIDRAAESQVSLWDALIIEAALAAGCTRLLTEDLNDGQRVEDLVVVNPFTSPGSSTG